MQQITCSLAYCLRAHISPGQAAVLRDGSFIQSGESTYIQQSAQSCPDILMVKQTQNKYFVSVFPFFASF